MARWGLRHRFELTRLETAGVLISVAAALSGVFLLGVYAGSGLGGRQLASEGQVVTLPVAPVSEEPAERNEPTIDDTVGTSARLATAPSGETALPGPRGERPEPTVSAGRIEGRVPATTEGSEPAPGAGAKREPAPPAPTPKTRAALAGNKPAPGLPGSAGGGNWSVQVSASRDPSTADAMLRRLRAKGYDAYVVRVRRQGGTFFRVRVGRYASMEQASQMVTRLRREREVPEAFVASD
jgi:cell division septation protein DedD